MITLLSQDCVNTCLEKGDDCRAVNWKLPFGDGWTCFFQESGYGPMYDFDSVSSVEMCCLENSCPGNLYLSLNIELIVRNRINC